MTVLKWEAPPAPQGGPNRENLDGLTAKLQAAPGRWALVKEDHNRHAWAALTKRGVVTTGRSNPDGTYRIYAMWPVNE